MQRCCNKNAAQRFFRRLLKSQSDEPRWLVIDKLRSYNAAYWKVLPITEHINPVCSYNRAEVSHKPTLERERAIRGFRSSNQAQRFLTLHGLTQNLFRPGGHLIQAVHYRV